MALLFMLAVVLPIYFDVGEFLMTPTRIICLIALFLFSFKLFVLRSYGRPLVTDYLMLFYSFWVMLSFLNVHGTSAFVYASLQVTNTFGGYLIGRATIRTVGNLQAVARGLAVIILVLLPFAIYENFYAVYVIPDFIKGFDGVSTVSEVNYGTRLGLDRVQAVFTHPIHWGLYASLGVSLYAVGMSNLVSLGKRIFVALLIVLASFTSLSSGPFLSAVFQCLLIFYAVGFYAWPNQWKIMLWGTGVSYVLLELASTRFLFYALGSRLAFNSGTAHYRTLIWEYGTMQVERTPLFGVGQGYWVRLHWMTPSIDNFWLERAVVNGIPASFSLIALFLYTAIRIGKGTYVKGTDAYHLRVAVTILLIGLGLALSTVTVWNEALSMIMFLVGAAGFMLQAQPVEVQETETEPRKVQFNRHSGVRTRATGRTPQVYTRFGTDPPEKRQDRPVPAFRRS